jgi:O-antigen/teichoic acid export membrane protein
MIKAFFKDSLFYTLSTMLTRGLAFALLPFYTHFLGPEDFGVLDYLTILGSLLAVTVTLDIGQGLARYVPEFLDDSQKLRRFASTSLWFTVCNYTILFLLIVAFRERFAERLLGSAVYAEILVVAAGLYWVNSLVLVVQAQLRWELRALQCSLVGAVNAIITVAFSAVFLLYCKLGVPGALLGQIVGASAAAAVGFLLARERFRLAFDWSALHTMLTFSLPLVPSSVGVVVAMYIDRFAIKTLMSLADVGLYGVGNRVALIVSIGMVGFQGALTPLIYARHQDPTTPGDLARLFSLFAAVSLVLLAALMLFSDQIIGLIAPESYSSASAVIPYLATAAVFSGLYVFAPGLEIEKRTGVIALINVGVAFANMVLNFALIPLLGITGAALATMISSFAGFVVKMVLSQRFYLIPHSWPKLISAATMTAALAWIAMQINIGKWSTVGLRSGLLLLMAYVLAKIMVVDRVSAEAQLVTH